MCFQFLYLISFSNRPLRVDIEFSITTLSSDYKHIKLFQIKKHIPNRIAENSNGKVIHTNQKTPILTKIISLDSHIYINTAIYIQDEQFNISINSGSPK